MLRGAIGMRLVMVNGLTLPPLARRSHFLLWWAFGIIVGAEVMELDSCWRLLRLSWLVRYLRHSFRQITVVHLLVVYWLYFNFCGLFWRGGRSGHMKVLNRRRLRPLQSINCIALRRFSAPSLRGCEHPTKSIGLMHNSKFALRRQSKV
jgi:hypothetical protein